MVAKGCGEGLRACTVSDMAKNASPKPKLSDAAKNALRNQRRRLATEQADVSARRAMEARSVLDRVTRPAPMVRPERYIRSSTAVAFQKGVIPRTSAVLASEGLEVRLLVNLSQYIGKSAYTDFTTLFVNYPVSEESDVAEVAAILRGTLYHEGGHCRFTEQPEQLMRRYLNMALPVPDLPTYEQARDKRTQASDMWVNRRGMLHHAWNLCEDQRMEMLVVEDSPRKAAYFAPMVIDMVIDWRKELADPEQARIAYDRYIAELALRKVITDEEAQTMSYSTSNAAKHAVAGYPLIAWRRYLPRDLRRAMRAAFVDVWGNAMTHRIERLILTYVKAADPVTAVDALVELAPLLKEVMTPIDASHGSMTRSWGAPRTDADQQGATMEGSDGDYEEADDDDADDDADDGDTAGKGADEGDDADDGDTEGKGAGEGDEAAGEGDEAGASDEETEAKGEGKEDGDASHGVNAGDEDGKHNPLDEMLQKAKNEAEATRNADPSLQGDIAAFNDAMYSGDTGSMLDAYLTRPTDNLNLVAEAQNMAQNVVQAFQQVNTERQPTWQEQQTRGVINVGRFVTRQIGDREFFRCWADEVAPGRNLAVSLLLDYSGSMGNSTDELSTTAYAMKAACDELGMPCTVVLWDHTATVLWDGKDKAEFVPVIDANGGTNPRIALEDLQHHRFNKEAHIVLVMTDGEFSVSDNWLNEYRTEGTYFIGAVYGSSNKARAESTMAQMGFDRYAAIDTLQPIVSMLEEAIIDMAAM